MTSSFIDWRAHLLKANQRLMENEKLDLSSLSPESIRLIKGARFTAERINEAFAKAREQVRQRTEIPE
jgi:hypothetical protein